MSTPLSLYTPPAPSAQSPTSAAPSKHRKALTLADLHSGDAARVLRVAIDDAPCRRRLAELGIAEGMVVSVTGVGETMMLALGDSRFGLARSCARHIQVVRKK